MSVYTTDPAISSGNLVQSEVHLYGSSRLGIFETNRNVQTLVTSNYLNNINTFVRGNKFFELSNHLGNVLATISDKKIGVDDGAYNIQVICPGCPPPPVGEPSNCPPCTQDVVMTSTTPDGVLDYYRADVVTANDYYPGGMLMPGRKFTAGGQYRYGFNGQEKSDDVTQGNYTAEFWEYDSRISRRWNLDPVVKSYESPYVTFGGNPIVNIDPNGADTINITRTTTRQKLGGQRDGHSDALVIPSRTIITQSGSISVQAAKGEDVFRITDLNVKIDENGNQTSTSKTTILNLNGNQSHFRYGGRNMKGYQDDRYALAANAPTWLLKYYAEKSGGDIGVLSAIAYQKSVPFAAGLGKVMNVAYTVTGVYGVFRFTLSKMAVGEITDATIAKALQGSTMQTTQNSVSLPAIKRYVEMLKSVSASPAIKVADGVIVDGNHRYIAGRIMGIEPPQVPGTLAPSMKALAKPIQHIKVDPLAWPNH